MIAFDRPGFGYSERPGATSWTAQAQADLIRTALRRIGVRKPIVVGHSWGTLVALAMAAADPPDTAGLVLLAGYYFPQRRLDAALVSITAVPLVGRLLYHTLWPVAVRLLQPGALRAIFAPSPVPPSFRDNYPLPLALRPSHIRASVLDTAAMTQSVRRLSKHYGALRIPVTIFAGAGDRVVNTRPHAQRLHQAIPGSTFRLLQNAGHMIHYDAPDQVADAVLAITQAASASWQSPAYPPHAR